MAHTPEQVTRTTGEFAVHRRRALDIPTDAPPEKIRQEVRAEVEDSLRTVCSNWPTGEFDRVVANVTETAMKYHGRERHNRKSAGTAGFHLPVAATAISLVTSATKSVKDFLQMEILPLK